MGLRHVAWVNEAPVRQGGCEQYIINTAGLLRARGLRCTFLYDGARTHASAEMLGAFDGAFPLVDPQSQIDEIRPDVIFVHRMASPETLAALASAGAPSIRFFHDYNTFCLREHKYRTLSDQTCTRTIGLGCYPCLGFVNRTPRGWRLSTLRPLKRRIAASKGFTAIATPSEYMRQHVIAHGFPPERVHALPLYALPPATGDAPPREGDLVLFVGQVIRSKGLDVLLQALPRMKGPVRLAVAGAGHQEDLFRRMARDLGIEGRVSFLGSQAHEAMAQYYRRAACVVVPSRYPETFCLIGPEAMSHGAPVVGTRVGAIGEWLTDGDNGFSVPPNDPAALASAIDRLLGDPDLAARMGERGRTLYLERFQPQHHLERLIDLFEKVVAAHGTAAEPAPPPC